MPPITVNETELHVPKGPTTAIWGVGIILSSKNYNGKKVSRKKGVLWTVLPDPEQTLSVVRTIVATGVEALAVHGRTKDERPNNDVHVDAIQRVVQEVAGRIPGKFTPIQVLIFTFTVVKEQTEKHSQDEVPPKHV